MKLLGLHADCRTVLCKIGKERQYLENTNIMTSLFRTVSFFWFLQSDIFLTVLSDLSVRPKHSEIVIGKSARFNCSTTNPAREIQWFHYPLGAKEKDYVYAYSAFQGTFNGRLRLAQNASTGSYDILIPEVIESDAGVFECQDDAGNGVAAEAELIVLRSEPICSSNIENGDVMVGPNSCGIPTEVLQLSCRVGYIGKTAPLLAWKKFGDGNKIMEGVHGEATPNVVSLNLTAEALPKIDGQSFICQSTRLSSSNEYSCSSGVINIWHMHDNFIMIERMVGDVVQCPTVNWTSICGYKWTRIGIKGEVVVSTNSSIKPDAPGVYRCEINCTIKTRPCSVSAMLVQVTAITATTETHVVEEYTTGSYKAAFIAVLIVLFASIVALIIVLFLFLRQRKKSPRDGPEEHNLLNRTTDTTVTGMTPQKQTSPESNYSNNSEIKTRVGINYCDKPTLLETIKTQTDENQDKAIKGLALLNNEFYIISQKESEVGVYDSTTLKHLRRWVLEELTNPEDASACVRNRCLYISDNKEKNSTIFRVDPNGKVIVKWSTGSEAGRLSVTSETHVIVTVYSSSTLQEYSSTGEHIRAITLSNFDIDHPMHAIKLLNGNFIVTYGLQNDAVHRICEIDVTSGRIIKFFGSEKGTGNRLLTNPTYLAIDWEGSIMVADSANSRVILLGSNFEFKREIVSKVDQVQTPTRILLDELNGRLLVGDRKARCLLIFGIKFTLRKK